MADDDHEGYFYRSYYASNIGLETAARAVVNGLLGEIERGGVLSIRDPTQVALVRSELLRRLAEFDQIGNNPDVQNAARNMINDGEFELQGRGQLRVAPRTQDLEEADMPAQKDQAPRLSSSATLAGELNAVSLEQQRQNQDSHLAHSNAQDDSFILEIDRSDAGTPEPKSQVKIRVLRDKLLRALMSKKRDVADNLYDEMSAEDPKRAEVYRAKLQDSLEFALRHLTGSHDDSEESLASKKRDASNSPELSKNVSKKPKQRARQNPSRANHQSGDSKLYPSNKYSFISEYPLGRDYKFKCDVCGRTESGKADFQAHMNYFKHHWRAGNRVLRRGFVIVGIDLPNLKWRGKNWQDGEIYSSGEMIKKEGAADTYAPTRKGSGVIEKKLNDEQKRSWAEHGRLGEWERHNWDAEYQGPVGNDKHTGLPDDYVARALGHDCPARTSRQQDTANTDNTSTQAPDEDTGIDSVILLDNEDEEEVLDKDDEQDDGGNAEEDNDGTYGDDEDDEDIEDTFNDDNNAHDEHDEKPGKEDNFEDGMDHTEESTDMYN